MVPDGIPISSLWSKSSGDAKYGAPRASQQTNQNQCVRPAPGPMGLRAHGHEGPWLEDEGPSIQESPRPLIWDAVALACNAQGNNRGTQGNNRAELPPK